MSTRHVLVTGGSRGIGLAIAQLFALNAYRCTLLSRNPESLTSAIETLGSLNQPSSSLHTYISGDVSSQEFWTRDFESQYRGSQVHVLVNCAGITQSSLLVRTEPAKMQQIVDTNLTGVMIGTRHLLRKGYLKRKIGDDSRTPVIINVASLLGTKGGSGAVAYAASKAGVIGFTRALSEELAKSGIRVNAILPGYISTDMTRELAQSKSLLSKIPAGRFGTPAEVAHATLFLTENQYANNCVLNLDGGLSAT